MRYNSAGTVTEDNNLRATRSLLVSLCFGIEARSLQSEVVVNGTGMILDASFFAVTLFPVLLVSFYPEKHMKEEKTDITQKF